METLKNKERATIKRILTNLELLDEAQKDKVLWITQGMAVAKGIEYGQLKSK